MKKYTLIIFTFLIVITVKFQVNAQSVGIGINSFTPDASSMLEIQSSTKGLLIPRVALTQTTSASPVTSPLTSLLIYNTATVNDVKPGYYYWDGGKWVRFISLNSGSGNLNYVPKWTPDGTTLGNSQIFDNGNVGIGTTSPGNKLDVNGNISFLNSLNTPQISNITPVYIRGTGLNNSGNRIVSIGNTSVVNGSGRGLTLTIINKSDHSILSNTNYDTYGDATASDNLSTALNALSSSQIGILTSWDAWEGQVNTNLDNAFKRLGLYKAYATVNSGSRRPYAAIFEAASAGETTDKVVEISTDNTANQPFAEIRGWLIEGSFIASGSNQNSLTTPQGTALGVLVDPSGNVGIGTSSPGYKLDVTGQERITIASGTPPIIIPTPYTFGANVINLSSDLLDGYHADNASGNIPISNGTANTNLNADMLDGYHYNNLPYLSSASGTTNYVAKFTATNSIGISQIYDNGSNVGVGTNNPLNKFQVSTPTNASQMTLGSASGIAFSVVKADEGYGLYSGISGNGDVWLQAGRTSTTTAYNLLLQASGGNVGIGTTNPAQGKLWVQDGDIWITGNNRLAFSSDESTDNTPNVSIRASGNDTYFTNWSGSSYLDRMMIQGSSGNVGIGITSPSAKLDISEAQQSEFYGTDNAFPTSNLIIRGTGTSRTFGTGSAIEFVIPANTDGSNPWAQARILATPDNGSNGNAEGALYLQTRANYNPGVGGTWNWRSNMVLRASGNVGIGNTLPAYKLHIGLNNSNGIMLGNYNDRLGWDGTGTQPYYAIRFTGYRDVVNDFTGAMIAAVRTNICCSGLSQGSYLSFRVMDNASATASGDANLIERAEIAYFGVSATDYFTLSDKRLKSKVSDIEYGLKDVLQMKPVKYTQIMPRFFKESTNEDSYTTDKINSFGFIAQELNEVVPEIVNKPEDEKAYWSISYGKLTPILVKAIQEQQSQIEYLKKQTQDFDIYIQLVKEQQKEIKLLKEEIKFLRNKN